MRIRFLAVPLLIALLLPVSRSAAAHVAPAETRLHAAPPAVTFSPAERAELAAAQAASPGLAELRGGDLDHHHEYEIALVVLLGIIALALIF
jgi:hypothetical protein